MADPQGFLQRVQNVMLNERLNNSEQMLRREVGAEKVDAAIEDFARRRKTTLAVPEIVRNKILRLGLQAGQAHQGNPRPGDDPTAYRTRIEAEARAKWEAEQRRQHRHRIARRRDATEPRHRPQRWDAPPRHGAASRRWRTWWPVSRIVRSARLNRETLE